MRNQKLLALAVVGSLLVPGLGVAAPSTLGNLLRPHAQSESGFPAPDGGNLGALLFGTDAGVLYVNDGVNWTPVMVPSTADVNLFVDPTGSDTNRCTSTGTAACATLQAALNKAPKQLYHRLTVTMAPGNYAGATISGFIIDPSRQRATAGILIEGALTTVTPATGSATGTTTSGTAGTGSTWGTLTDSGATWTVNDPAIVGKFVTASQAQTRVVVSNTATTLTVAGTWTSPTGAYTIQKPSVVFTTAAATIPKPQTGALVSAAAIQIIDNACDASSITIRNVTSSIAASSGVIVYGNNAELVQVVVEPTSTNGVLLTGSGNLTLTTCSITATGGPAAVQATNKSVLVVNTSRVLNSGGTGLALFIASQSNFTSSTGNQLNGLFGLGVQGGSRAVPGPIRCDCSSIAASACIQAGSAGGTTAMQGVNILEAGSGVDVTNCHYGVLVHGPSEASFGTGTILSGNALTYGANATFGAAIIIPTNLATITGATAEMAVDDGALTGTWASLAAKFACLPSTTGTMSRICRR